MSAPDYPEFRRQWDDGLDPEALISTFWHPDGPYSRALVTAAADAMDRLAHYLARATAPWVGGRLPHGADLYRLVGELRSTLGRLDQVLDQVAHRAGEMAGDPTLYDDRGPTRDPADTARELQGALDAARVALGPLAVALGAAHSASGHLGHRE